MWPSLGGVMSILLIFPAIGLGARFAGASPIGKTRARRVAAAVVLGACVALLVILPVLSPFSFLLILLYTVLCVVHIIRQGFGFRRFLIGASVIIWMALCMADYAASVEYDSNRMGFNEAAAFRTLRMLATAEKSFADKAHAEGVVGPTFATIRELRTNDLVQDDLTDGRARRGFLFREIVDPSKKTFLFYAVPAHYPQGQPYWSGFVPGAALWFDGWHREQTRGTGMRAFAVDQTGVVRGITPPPTTPITRELVALWPPV